MKSKLLLSLILLFTGCAMMKNDANQTTEQLLAAAGFHEYLAKNDQEQANLEAIPQRQLVSMHGAVKPTYIYADDHSECNCVFVGGAAEYAAYQQLDHAKRGADNQVITAQNRDAMMSGGRMGGAMGGYW